MEEKKLPRWVKKVETVLEKAEKEGRNRLFEHEVYEILEKFRIKTPTYQTVHHEDEITNDTLSKFSNSRIVLKIISGKITHKYRAGGVQIVYKDLDFVRYSVQKMRKSFQRRLKSLEGILLVDFIDYSKDLGNEILLGFRESEAFGPVISFSKGGIDAEHFATNFSAPNLILPPINRKWASALQASTRIQKKYLDEGKTGYIKKIVETEVKLSDLAIYFSNFFNFETKFSLKEFEINPFVFDEDGNFIAIDGFATFAEKDKEGIDLLVQPKETLRPFFEPDGIAVVGVSTTDSSKAGNIIVKNLLDMGRDDIFPVNIKGGEALIDGGRYRLYRSIAEVPPPVELAIIAVPAESTLPVIGDCVKKKVKAAIIIPGGFSETRKNREIEKKILEKARKNGIRIMGPNCLGIIYAGNRISRGINTFFIPGEKFRVNLEKEKNVAILSQSGALGITEIYNLRNAISPRVIVSYGNQLDIDPSDLVQYFEDDPSVDVIGLYIEGFKKGAGRKFFNVAGKSTKPIIVYKAGRTEAGMKAARSHTASIAGEYAVAKAAMKQAGLIVADSMIDHGDFIKTFALLHDFKVTGNRVAVIANAGYEKTYAADNLGSLIPAMLDEKTIKRLEKIIPPFVNVEPFLDLTAMASDELFQQCIEIFLESGGVDALCISIVPQAQVLHTTDEEINRYRENVAARIVETVHKYKKPTVVSVNVVSGADAAYNKFGQLMDSGGVPTFLTAERAMVCLNEFIRYKLIREKNVFSEWLKE
ncbi:MAG: acetate--CoA ligase family protein [Spirochaetota bacterium]